MLLDFPRDDFRCREDAEPVCAEDLEQGTVVELGDQVRPDPVPGEPLVERPSQGQILGWQEQWGTIERAGKTPAVSPGQGGRREEADRRLAEQVMVRPHRAAGGHRRVGDDEVERVLR